MSKRPKRDKRSGAQKARDVRIKKRLISRRQKTKKIEVVSRKSQGPKWKMTIKAPVLDKSISVGGQVASSWISAIVWDATNRDALMYLLNGYFYSFQIPFKVYQQWYYSPSKGTFFNEYIKGKYKYKRLSPR